MSTLDLFESVEKKLFLRVSRSTPCLLNNLAQSVIDEYLLLCGCSILKVSKTNECHSFILSESSLFIWKDCLYLKTCGKSNPLLGLNFLLRHMQIEWLRYEHGNYADPSDQLTFTQELEIIRSLIPDRSVKHDISADSCFIEIEEETCSRNFSKEIVAKHISNIANIPLTEETFLSLLKISPNDILDVISWKFDPQGFSMNAILANHIILTVHVTPQIECSYLSLEILSPSNTPIPDFLNIPETLNLISPSNLILIRSFPS
jgi:S-adenosylmethionine decarboxylase